MEYRILRDYASRKTTLKKIGAEMTENIRKVINYPRKFIIRHRDPLFRLYRFILSPAHGKVAEINFRALFDKNLNVIIFPEGTRSLTLGTGKTGIAHLALKSGKKVVPVGCNGSDRVYPGKSPLGKERHDRLSDWNADRSPGDRWRHRSVVCPVLTRGRS